MSDEGLDNLFKQGLAGRDVKFNMESWRRMEQMLPPEPKAKAFRFGYAAAFIGFLLIVSSSLFIWNDGANQGINELNGNVESELASQNDINSESNNSEGNLNNTTAVNKSEELNETASVNNASTSVQGSSGNGTSAISYSSSANISGSTAQMSLTNLSSSGNSRNGSNTGSGLFNTGLFAGNKNKVRPTEEQMAFSSDNAFTKISGLDEMATLSLIEEDETITFVTNVNNKKRPGANKNMLGFIGGVNLNPSLVSGTTGVSGSEFLGLEYQRFLNGGFSFKADLMYSSRNEINTRKINDVKYYDFGSATEQTMVETQRLLYMELPLLLNYNMGNHNIMVGPSVSYLMTGLNKVTTQYVNSSESYVEETSEWGYTDGFKSYDVALVAGYEYSVKERLNVGMRLNYGLVDITDNNYFGSDSYDNNVQLRLYLTFSPFQF